MSRGICAIAALVAVAALSPGCALDQGRAFGPAGRAEIPAERLFDLGVADFDEDGRLDIFTVNHKFAGAWLRNKGGGRFEDVTEAIGADPDPEFPGLDLRREPALSEPGAYVYMTDSEEGEPGLLHIRTVGVEAAGKIGFLSTSLRIERADRAHIRLGINDQSVRVVHFRARPGAAIVLDPSSVADAPMAAFFSTPTDPEMIKVGTAAVSPETLDFRLTLRDRHAIALANLVGDESLDAFIASGGLSGGIARPEFRDRIRDELLVGTGDGFSELTDGAGLGKGICRGRQAAAVDFDRDGLLDLFESCEEEPPLIHRQVEPGRFEAVAAPPASGTSERWVQLDDGPPVLLIAGGGELTAWRWGGDGFRREQTVPLRADGDVGQLALGDPDGDLDLDVLAVATSGNTMLRNDGGRLHPVPPRWAGAPRASAAASFVDYENDGRVDLHAVPQGLIRNDGDGRHHRTGLLRTAPAGAAIDQWADFDGDGLRDPLIAIGKGEFAPRMQVRRARNIAPIRGHWLEIDLTGTAGNRQAIGARAVVRAGRLRQAQWVGQNDDAPHSQGHYRLYFGLGPQEAVDAVTIRWPDGSRTEIGPRPADQLLRIEQGG
jgi:hypothetical protein